MLEASERWLITALCWGVSTISGRMLAQAARKGVDKPAFKPLGRRGRHDDDRRAGGNRCNPIGEIGSNGEPALPAG
jgi:hypothetical protein